MDFKFEARPVLALDMPPLTYDPEIKDLVFIYKAIYGFIAIDVSNYVTFNNHPRTCAPWPVSASCYLTVPACKTRTLQASYFVRTGGDNLCNEALPSGVTSVSCLQLFLKNLHHCLLMNVFDADMVC